MILPVSIPTPRKPPPSIDVADFLAVKVVLQAVIADQVSILDREASGMGAAYLNALSEICQEALLRSEISVRGIDSDRLKRETIERLNQILRSISADPIKPPSDG